MITKHSICLLHTPCPELNDDRLEPPMGLLYLATWVRRHGFDATVCDLSSVHPDRYMESIPPADVYGFSTYTVTYQRTLQIARAIKRRHPDAVTVAGGAHASALPDDVVEDFDYVVVGEGENALLRLLNGLSNPDVAMQRVLREPRVDQLDTLPFPDYGLVDIQSYGRLIDGRPSLSILTSRGCPYLCVFCNSTVMNADRSVRFRSPENVVREIRDLRERWGITSFRFQDDTFGLSLPRLRAITKLLQNEGITYRCFGRVDHCSTEAANLLFKGGCRHIAFGVESGSPAMLDRICKGQTVADIRHGIANAKAAGLVVRVFLLVGFPEETWETVRETADLMAECRPHEFIVYPLIPYPGTALFHRPLDFGITQINKNFTQYLQAGRNRRTGLVFQTGDLDEQKVAAMRDYLIRQLEPLMTWAGDSKLFR